MPREVVERPVAIGIGLVSTPGPGVGAWVVTDGAAGIEGQAIALVEALGFVPAVRRIRLRRPWEWLPPALHVIPLAGLDPRADALAPPWPALVVSSGRRAVAAASAIRHRAAGQTVVVHIQHPRVPPARFDLVVAPEHDRLRAANVVTTMGSLHHVDDVRLAEAAECWRSRFADLPRPLIAVLVGGDSRHYRLPPGRARAIAGELARLAREGCGLAVTMSRRTGPESARILAGEIEAAGGEVWDGRGDNPYLGMLALADHVMVTADSISMASEAAGTGRPVHLLPLEGGSARIARFHDALIARGCARWFDGKLPTWHYEPLRETARVAAAVRERTRLAGPE